MKKKLLSILVAAAMVICAIPMTASAGTKAPIDIAGTDIENSGDVSGITGVTGTINVQYYDSNGNTMAKYYGDSLNADHAVITLEDCTISVDATTTVKHCIGLSIDTEIVLKGNNTLALTNGDENDPLSIDKIYALKFSGAGQMNIECGTDKNCKTCFGFEAGVVDFTGAVKININSSGPSIEAKVMNFNLTEGGKIDATTNSSSSSAIGTSPSGTINIADNNKITTPVNGIKYNDTEDNSWYIANADTTEASHVVIEVPTTSTKAGVNTSDSSDIALFGIMGILALAGAGFVYKKREN